MLDFAIQSSSTGLRNRLYRNTLFFLGTWSFHYFPFFLMSRQKFLHHYLPAHLASALVAGAVLNFVLVEAVDFPVSVAGIKTRLRPASVARVGKSGYAVLAGLTVVVVGCWLWLAPFTYGMT
jgi:dolichyl-phosphate-mannose-protein mannosyltransferase